VIGLTLVVAGDEYFLTLFVVILFHQMFEGIALGSRIATIGTAADTHGVAAPRSSHDTSSAQDSDKAPPAAATETISNDEMTHVGLTMKKKLGLASLFAFITPIGMAIGIGVLQKFNGNDKSTLIAIGTLDAVSAGILMWVGLVEMWAADWMTGGHGHKAELADANILTTSLAFLGLVAGLVVMSLLGKWA
jgi:zinc transporter 1/2/3